MNIKEIKNQIVNIRAVKSLQNLNLNIYIDEMKMPEN